MIDHTNKTLGELLSHNLETIRRNAMSILKQLQRDNYDCEPSCIHEHLCIGANCKKDDKSGEYIPHDCDSIE